ncbi:MAG: alpha-2-macroglobulin family protein, partial [Phycisphaerae bacterium]
AEVELTMPENLTTWKARVWAMGGGARCGEGTAEVVTAKNLLVRLQAPRFFVQKDEVVLSANVHNYLKMKKNVNVVLEMFGGCLEHVGQDQPVGSYGKIVDIEAGGEARVDWRVKVVQPGEAIVRMKALTDEESDAMEMKFPVYVHGMLKTESFCGVIRPEKTAATIDLRVPAERRPDETRLEIRYSPTLAAAMVDALPYMAEYPYGCTEQTLNRFLPSVITQKALMRMGLDLKDIEKKRTNLNAQEIGDPAERAKQWQRFGRNPVFDEKLLADMVKAGVERLGSMQCSDGGWGWFSGWRERSWPHTTAVVVHGLQVARENDVAIVPGVLERGIAWLKRYQAEEVVKLKNGMKKDPPHSWKDHADNLDAFVYMVLADEKSDDKDMREFLYRDRNDLSVYAKAMFGLALHKLGHQAERDMLIRNVEQYLVQDEENQTAYLKLPEGTWWWCWYGSEIEADATYLKLLVATDPKGEKASRLVKYLLNNRKHATYWNSTRDTALCIEAFADYIKASGEDVSDMTVQILLDGKAVREVKIDKTNLFTFDGTVVLEGKGVTDGKHTLEFRKNGRGPLYFNAYLTNFTLEDPITRAGLEIKVDRKYYRLVPVDKTIKAAGARGQAVDQKVEKFEREPLKDLALLKSGDLVEIELEIESKNDYEYIMFEDMKAAGFEPVDLQSGYGGRGLGAYMELRDERVCFFVRWLARGKHSVSYRMRAEIPGRFSALPTRASAMYAPELRANSDEIKLRIED